jgi:hypothetical protein
MARLLRHARLGWIALAAIVGVLSSAEGAAAGTMAAGCEPDEGCCVSRPMPACGCCPSPTPSNAGASAGLADGDVQRELDRTASLGQNVRPCECRANDPAAPASKTDRTSPERRQGGDQSPICEVRHVTDEQPSPFAAPLVPPGSSPPRTPLYLRTSRLLF